MSASMEVFERFKRSGFAALKRGEYEPARLYLLEAARVMAERATQSTGELRAGQEQVAKELLDLAKSLKGRKPTRRAEGGRPAATAASAAGEEENAPKDWRVRERPSVTFEDIAGLDEAKAAIRLRMIYPYTHPHLAKKYAVRTGGGVLLYGPPGTGKTLLAKAVAGEIDAAFFNVKPSEIMSKWVGEAEQNIARLFAEAKAEPRAVIFIDEVEALVPRRREQSSTVMQRVVPQILQELEGFDKTAARALLFVGATNEPWSLDPAVMRPGRFDEKVYIPLPDREARRDILDMNLKGLPLGPDVDLDRLADLLEGYSGADLANLCHKAAESVFLEVLPTQEERDLMMGDFLAVAERLRPSVSPKDLAKFEQFAAQGAV
jgi:transitional endoplasmic reticulum ATPase